VAPTDEPRRFGLSTFDKQLACMGSVLGKPVLTEFGARTGLGRSLSEVRCALPVKAERLREDLRCLGLSILDAGDWYVLLESSRLEPRTPSNVLGGFRWRRLVVREKVGLSRPSEQEAGSRRLPPDQLQALGREMLRAMRPVSVPLMPELVQEEKWPEYAVASPDGVTTIRELYLDLDVQRLDPQGPELVIGLLRTTSRGFQGRLGVAEVPGEKLRLMWDSPVNSAFWQRVGYDDLNGDGIREIVLLADDPNRKVPYMKYLTAFDKDGNELTRQEECWPAMVLWDTPEGSACPLVGGTFDLVPAGSGRGKDIVVVDDGLLDKAECRYELKAGHYMPGAACLR